MYGAETNDIKSARDAEEIHTKLQIHGERRGVPCLNLQNLCKINAIQRAARTDHAEAFETRK